MAEIHPRLLQDCLVLGRLELCHVLLMLDARYPWLILVPDRDGMSEIHQLNEADQHQLMRESVALSRVLVELFRPDRLNVAALGNVVPQLHVHHIVRYRHDAAWPAPVWGRVPALPYVPEQRAGLVEQLTAALTARTRFIAA
jgi:diadenosine tetraphosphate (Ap4A) HIT family hydrolase